MRKEFKPGDQIQVVRNEGTDWLNGQVVTVSRDRGEYIEVVGAGIGGWDVDRFVPYSHATRPIPLEADTGGIYAGEADPSGISAATPGAKLDAGKLLPNLVIGEFSRALEAVARVGTKGARKYSPRGWLEVENGEERYAEAALRHQLKVWQGKPIDDGEGGTGELHKAQVIWNLLAALELELRREEAQ